MRDKRRLEDLALFGGPQLFDRPAHVGSPALGNRERFLARVNHILDAGWLTNNGRCVQELEERISGLLGVRHCVAVSSGTLALEIAIRAAGLQGEVLVPAFTFVATAHAVEWSGLTPVFCDVDPRTHTLAPELAEDLITDRTTAIMAVHLWGRPCAVDQLAHIAQAHGLSLLFDAAHAFAVSHGARMVGGFGDAEAFSFHATKFFHTLEGGAITTNNDELARKARLMRNFGLSAPDRVELLGTNGKMNEVSAAMGLTLLEDIEGLVEWNLRNYRTYTAELDGIPGISLYSHDNQGSHNYQYIVVEVDPQAAGVNRDQMVPLLRAEHVLARRYFYPGCHRLEPYSTQRQWHLPNTDRLAERVLVLPTGTAVAPHEAAAICAFLRYVVEHAGEIRARLAE